ncbi:PREDICTED: inhibin beta C chain-like isoform X3 [Eufriesea mexicana]|uniref:inhibin beta C chain-like isoform X3 n=1 Tax=Eufriesea mexicana TaxID=516756 RepID=UPI00083C3855|nr:PREDICTED: inhibin beta C chain-like isoform X3 [Eufriesea mexicana]
MRRRKICGKRGTSGISISVTSRTMRLIQRLLLFSFLLPNNQIEGIWPKVTNPLPSVWWNFYSRSSSSSSSSLSSFEKEDCAGCTQNKVGLISATDSILTELRVEYVKQQILKKLRLSKPPEISMSLSTLPKPLINGRVLELRPGAPLEPEKSIDSFYGKTDQIVVFPNEEGWVKADVSFTLKKWVEDLRLNHAIQVSCSTCSIDRDTAPVSVEQTLKPFLVMHTSPLPQKNRPKRNSNCLPEMKECCRDELYINFEDIGWSDWILHPSGYHAYFCRGSCSSAASLTISGSAYSNVIRRLLAKNGNAIYRKGEIVPCCSPTQLSPIQLLYVDSNNTITQKTLPNMVVEACGCM